MPKNVKAEWAAFGERLSWARTEKGLSQQELAEKLTEYKLGYPASRKMIAYWERLETDKQNDGDKTRLPYPKEYIAISEILGINGLWLFLYDREPSLSEVPPPEEESALYGHPPPRAPIEIEFYKLLRALTISQVESLVGIIKSFTRK